MPQPVVKAEVLSDHMSEDGSFTAMDDDDDDEDFQPTKRKKVPDSSFFFLSFSHMSAMFCFPRAWATTIFECLDVADGKTAGKIGSSDRDGGSGGVGGSSGSSGGGGGRGGNGEADDSTEAKVHAA